MKLIKQREVHGSQNLSSTASQSNKTRIQSQIADPMTEQWIHL